MTHHDAGKYSAKHPAGTRRDPAIEAAVRSKAENGKVACAVAHAIAAQFGVAPSEVGKAIDLLEYRLFRCQLGLFGYAPEKKIVKAVMEAPEALRNLLRQRAVEGRISCLDCWDMSRELGIGKMEVSGACESLGIRIKPCQLGAF
jgi:hypothetical protein